MNSQELTTLFPVRHPKVLSQYNMCAISSCSGPPIRSPNALPAATVASAESSDKHRQIQHRLKPSKSPRKFCGWTFPTLYIYPPMTRGSVWIWKAKIKVHYKKTQFYPFLLRSISFKISSRNWILWAECKLVSYRGTRSANQQTAHFQFNQTTSISSVR